MSDISILKFQIQENASVSRVFLKRILPLLQDAHDFAGINPPRPSVILERLDYAMDLINKEIERLTILAEIKQ